MGALDRFERQGDQIKEAYSSLQDEIFRLIINALKEGDYKHVDQDDVVLWQAQQLQKIGQLNRDTIRLMAQADGVSQQAIEDFVKFNGVDVADEVDDEVKQVAPQRTAMPAQTSVGTLMAGIAQQTWTNLQNNVNESLVTRNYGESAVTYTYRQILTESTAATVTGLSTHQDAVEAAIYRAVDRGLPTRLVDKAGHRWSMEGYTSMVVDTTTHRAYNEIRLKRMRDFHMGQCVMSSHPASRPACAPIQGQVVNIVPPDSPDFDPKYDGIYNHGYGEPSGTQGINCGHRLFPFVPGVSENHQPQYDPDEAIKNGKIVQKQRARERAIRDAKHRLAAAEELGDEKMISQAKTLIRGRQASMRKFIQETNHGRKTPLLHRDYSRERIVHRPQSDFMAKKHEFTIPSNSGKVLRVHTSQIRNARASVWTEGKTKKYRSSALRVDHVLRAYKTAKLPKVVITDSRKLGKSAIASYDHINDALFINSDILQNKASTDRYLKGDQFAASSTDDIIKHEMTHKFNWDKAKSEYRLHPNKYKDVDDAIETLNAKVMTYVKNVAFTDPTFLSHSKYLRDAFLRGNSREVVAELNVLKLHDSTLNKLIKEVLD